MLAHDTATAGLTTYTDWQAWFDDVALDGAVPITTIGFSEFPAGTVIRDQYADLGVNFSGFNFTSGPGCTIYPQDCWALQAGIGGATVEFDAPRHALALDHPGDAIMDLFAQGVKIATVNFDGGGVGNFSGIVSTSSFDSAVLYDQQAPSFIDDLHFVTIPAPGALFTLPGALLFRWRIRRRAASTSPRRSIRSCQPAVIALALLLLASRSADADITTYTERESWFDDVGAVADITTVGFSEFGLTTITDQYQHLGVTFTDGNDTTRGEDFIVFPRDGWGLDGNPDIAMQFDTPQHAIAVDYPGAIQFDLYMNGDLMNSFLFDPGGFGNFGGILSDAPFDSVVLTEPIICCATIDDLHFATIPTPATVVIVTLPIVLRSRIRRRGAIN